MFAFVLVILSIGNGEPPDPIATFRIDKHCDAIAYLLNQGFEQKNIDKKAVCVNTTTFGEI